MLNGSQVVEVMEFVPFLNAERACLEARVAKLRLREEMLLAESDVEHASVVHDELAIALDQLGLVTSDLTALPTC